MVKSKKTVASSTQKKVAPKTNATKKSVTKNSINRQKTSKKIDPRRHEDQKAAKFVPGLAIALFALLFMGSLYQLMRQSKNNIDQLIAKDVAQLQQVFAEIQKDCTILSFEHNQNYIDFLTVEKFVGSEVGSMNLLYPKKWRGPYLKDNMTMQQQQYVVAKTKSGYYIVPGEGVTLSNGKVMGQDIVVGPDTDMGKLMIDSDALQSAEGDLAAKITVGTSKFKRGLAAAGTKMYDIGF